MKIITFWQMPFQQKMMFFINLVLCSIAKIAITILPYRALSPYYGLHCQMLNASTLLSTHQIQQALHIKRSIALAVRYIPWRSNCLTQALVAKFWCQHFKLPYLFFIGLAKSSAQPLGKEGHAWVNAGPIAITGGNSFATHQVILTYSNVNFRP